MDAEEPIAGAAAAPQKKKRFIGEPQVLNAALELDQGPPTGACFYFWPLLSSSSPPRRLVSPRAWKRRASRAHARRGSGSASEGASASAQPSVVLEMPLGRTCLRLEDWCVRLPEEKVGKEPRRAHWSAGF